MEVKFTSFSSPERIFNLKILQLELWLEPARLGLITSNFVTLQGYSPVPEAEQGGRQPGLFNNYRPPIQSLSQGSGGYEGE